MKKLFYVLLTIFTSLFIVGNVYAECTKEELDHFKKIENQIIVKYKYDNELKEKTILVYIPDWERYTFGLTDKDVKCRRINGGYKQCTNIKEGKHPLIIIDRYHNCIFKTLNITIPKGDPSTSLNPSSSSGESLPQEEGKPFNSGVEKPINPYYKSSLCQGIEEFVLCQPDYDKDIDYDTFVSRVETYKRTKEMNKENVGVKVKKEINKITNYIKNNLLQVLVIFIFIVVFIISIIMIIKNIQKRRRFR